MIVFFKGDFREGFAGYVESRLVKVKKKEVVHHASVENLPGGEKLVVFLSKMTRTRRPAKVHGNQVLAQ